MEIHQRPTFRIWIEGIPLAVRSKTSRAKYLAQIREAAKSVVPYPSPSSRIDIEILFKRHTSLGLDADHVITPILAALKGMVYQDDRQVRSVSVVAFPADDATHLAGPLDSPLLTRLLKDQPMEFLLNIYEGLAIAGLEVCGRQ